MSRTLICILGGGEGRQAIHTLQKEKIVQTYKKGLCITLGRTGLGIRNTDWSVEVNSGKGRGEQDEGGIHKVSIRICSVLSTLLREREGGKKGRGKGKECKGMRRARRKSWR